MNKSVFTIKDLQKIFKWSYPTALNFARNFGSLDPDRGRGTGSWVVDYDVVQFEVTCRQRVANNLTVRFGRAAERVAK